MGVPVCFSFAIDLLTFMEATPGRLPREFAGTVAAELCRKLRCTHCRCDVVGRFPRGIIARIDLQTKPLENTRLGLYTTAKSDRGKTWPRKFRLTAGR